MALRDARQWLAEVLGALAEKVQPRPEETPARGLQLVPDLRGPAMCPICSHHRGRHQVIDGGTRGPCLAPDCGCHAYAGPWPVHHVHVTTERCSWPECGRPGGHWAVQLEGGALVSVARYRDLPGEAEADQLVELLERRVQPGRAVRSLCAACVTFASTGHTCGQKA